MTTLLQTDPFRLAVLRGQAERLGILFPGTPEHTAFWAARDAEEAARTAALDALDAEAEAAGWSYAYDGYALRAYLVGPDGRIPVSGDEVSLARDGRRIRVATLRAVVAARPAP